MGTGAAPEAGRAGHGGARAVDARASGDCASEPPHSLVALIRLVIAASAAIVYAIEGSEAGAMVIGVGVSMAYVVYAALLYVLTERQPGAASAAWRYWADVAWYTLLVLPSGGLDSAMFPFFFFPILVASIRDGFAGGVRVSVASAGLAVVTGILPLPPAWRQGQMPLAATLSHALLLLLVGYLIALWGSKEAEQRRRLTLLGTLTRLPNPRLGPQQIMGHCLEHIRDFHGAQSCVAVLRVPEAACLLFLADGDPARPPVVGKEIDATLSAQLLDLHARVFVWSDGAVQALSSGEADDVIDTERAAAVAELLDAPRYLSVPLARHGNDMGRLYLARRGRAFSVGEAAFVRDLADHVAPMIENIHILDRIATDATLHEREKISRDLHDSTIQPYIGLKLGLEALRRRVAGDGELAGELDDLIDMTNEGITELRRYVGGLRDRDLPRETSLVHAIWRVAEKYRDYYGIDIAVNADPDLRLNDRLAAEVFQVVNEGLSNVRRHTASRSVTLNLRRQAAELVVQVVNHAAGGAAAIAPFRPRSIVERVQHLGGRVDVVMQPDGGAVVTAEIPL